jgi:hypothetical protein
MTSTDKQSKIFFLALFLLIALSVGVSYYRFFVAKDYVIEAQADCDPAAEACFVSVCDPQEEQCSGDPEEDTSYYKVVHRKAANIPLCNPNDEGCDALVCQPDEEGCEEILCDPNSLAEGQQCSDPEAYKREHPAEEEGASEEACDGGSADCAGSEGPESASDGGVGMTEEGADGNHVPETDSQSGDN